MLALSAFSGLSYGILALYGQSRAPNPVQQALPNWLIVAWSALLVVGPGLTLVGTYWASQTFEQIITGLLIQRRGLFVTGIAALIYSFLLLVYATQQNVVVQALLTGTITVAYAASCFWRQHNINRDIKGITGRQDRKDGHDHKDGG